MRKIKTLLKEIQKGLKEGFISGIFLLGILLVVGGLIYIVPSFIDLTVGNKIIKNHINDVVSNENNSVIISQRLLKWIRNNTISLYNKEPIYTFGGLWSIYIINNKPVLFIRSNKASWFIIAKTGNCGEKAWYFAQIMQTLGFKSRVIQVKGEDHTFVEYYDKNKWIAVDPSLGIFIMNNTHPLEKIYEWSYVEAIDLKGHKEVLTKKYVTNTSKLTIKLNKNNRLKERYYIAIYSTTLKKKHPNLYVEPILILEHYFRNNNTFTIELRSKDDYILAEGINLYLLRFEVKRELNLTQSTTQYIDKNEIMKLENIKITWIGWIFIVMVIMICAIYITYRLKHITLNKLKIL